jgi:hypothetical protein
MSRNGKIARLPGLVRDELNQRLENGEEGPTLLAWLNGQPEVQRSLKDYFEGAPVTKQNLSEWRQGGFREWQIREALIEQASRLSESADDMDNCVEIPLLAGKLAAVLAARYAALLNSWDGEPDPKFEEKVRVLRGLNRDIAVLQKTMQQADRQKRDLEQAAEDREKKIEKQVKEEAVAPIWAMAESRELAGVFGGGERGRKLAEIVTAVKYDLPPPKWTEALRKKKEMRDREARSEALRQAKSKPVQLNPAESDPVAAGPSESDQADSDVTAQQEQPNM